MTRSIFDPTGGETERSGSTHLGPAPGNLSHMPPAAVDGEVEGEGEGGVDAVDRADDTPDPLAASSDEAARRLTEITSEDPDAELGPSPSPPSGA